MKNKSSKTSSELRRTNPILAHPFIFVVIALGLALVVIIIFRVVQDHETEVASDTEVSVPTATVDTATNVNESSTAPDIIPEKTPAQYEGENANNSPTLTGAITASSVIDDKLIIRVTIDQLLSSTGTCTLSLTSAGRTLTYNANTIDNPSSASCEGFDIPLSDLYSGDWDIKINIDAGDRTGVLEGKVTI